MPRASKASRASKPAKTAAAKNAVVRRAAGAKATARKAATRKAAPLKGGAKKVTTVKKAAPAKRPAKAPARKAAPLKVGAKRPAPRPVARRTAPRNPLAKKATPAKTPARRSLVKDKFLLEQKVLLREERATYVEQAEALKAEADQLAAEMEPGDIQFDDESGEGATATVDRERDLALSAQARQEVEEIDHALAKIKAGTYGLCENCGQPIPKARLKAIPHARLCVACKSGGLSRR
jgi:DnaK suppressor protein